MTYDPDQPRDESGRWSSEGVMGTKTGGPGGSNPGGFYRGKDGVDRYVKLYNDPQQAHSEQLANQIYADLGHISPESQTFEHEGKTAYASKIIEGVQLQDRGLDPVIADRILNGYVADVVTANWDAIGLVDDNILVTPSGHPVRVDNGGTFVMRAKGGLKPRELLLNISEFDKFADPNVNPSYARVFKAAGTSPQASLGRFKGQVQALIKLRDRSGGWNAYVNSKVPNAPGSLRRDMAAMLDSRTEFLERKVGLATRRFKP